MKKNLLFTVLLGLLIPVYSTAQNLLQNADFEQPGTGKYRGDCAADGCFNGNVPYWFTDPGCTDTGVEHGYFNGNGGAWCGFAYNMDGATFQVVGEIDASSRAYTLTYWSMISWSNITDPDNNKIYYVTYFYSFEGTDTVGKVKLDTLAVLAEGWTSSTDRDTNYYQHTHTFTIPESEIGKNLAVGFDGTSTLSVNPNESCWTHFDNFELTVGVTGIKNTEREVPVSLYPNPSKGIVEVKCPLLISKIEVFDITGKIVISQAGYNKILDLTNNGAGIYFLRVVTNNNDVIMKKLIIE